MYNRDVLSLFSLMSIYCDSVNCDSCIIKDICECTYDEIRIPCYWVELLKKELRELND